MLISLIRNPRRRGVFGASLGGLAPFAVSANEYGIALGGDSFTICFVCVASAFFGVLGYGVFHAGFRRIEQFPSQEFIAVDRDGIYQATHSGSYEYRRDAYDRR